MDSRAEEGGVGIECAVGVVDVGDDVDSFRYPQTNSATTPSVLRAVT